MKPPADCRLLVVVLVAVHNVYRSGERQIKSDFEQKPPPQG
jgi:hypothetical protein